LCTFPDLNNKRGITTVIYKDLETNKKLNI